MEELADPEQLSVTVDRNPVHGVEWFCTDPVAQRYEFNFDLPPNLSHGWHHIYMRAGRREFAPVPIEVA
jgi:hypothetical protein